MSILVLSVRPNFIFSSVHSKAILKIITISYLNQHIDNSPVQQDILHNCIQFNLNVFKVLQIL